MNRSATFDIDWFTEQLAVGGSFAAAAVPVLAGRLGIRVVVDLREEDCDDERLLARHGIAFLRLPTPDVHAVSARDLERGVAFVRAHTAAGHKVLVHCQHGIGRSALLACCVFVAGGMEPVEALEQARRCRPKVSLSEAQCQAMLGFAERTSNISRGGARALQQLLDVSWGPAPQQP